MFLYDDLEHTYMYIFVKKKSINPFILMYEMPA